MLNAGTTFSEYELTQTDFEKISRLIYEQSGIALHEGKKELVRARLGKRLRQGRFKSFRDYYQFVVQDDTGEELVYLLDSISTNLTSFFREQVHFDFLQQDLIPRWRAAKPSRDKALHIWSAGCSTGEEVYSIAITLLETLGPLEKWDLKLLASDISTRVLKKAVAGIYEKERVRTLPPATVKKYFLRGENNWRDHVKIKNSIKDLVVFKRVNLMEPFSFQKAFDCIFCRNVMIYFDKKTQETLVNRFYQNLQPEGVLFIGHSESLTGIQHPFQYLRPAVYKR
ncbi:MAG: protein-glutamate O-methyltransferase CheR [Deltaproteobacteria bacterium]|nr:protein-glutamate O-methyltransferase CheR [Deltaproteobacteria bacterium]